METNNAAVETQLSDLRELARTQFSQFLLRVPKPVFLISHSDHKGGLQDPTLDEIGPTLEGKLPSHSGIAAPTVIPVYKRFTASLTDIIWLGRAVTCDVILPFGTVSKIHAILSRDQEGQLVISDVGSKNGTWLNGSKLMDARRAPLHDLDVVRFGSTEVRFMEPPSFYRYLQNNPP